MEERKRGKGGGREREKRLMHSEEGVTNEHREWEFNRLFKTKTALLMYVEQGKPRREGLQTRKRGCKTCKKYQCRERERLLQTKVKVNRKMHVDRHRDKL